MSEKTKKKYTAAEKVALLKKHLIEKQPISKICEENQLQPKLFYKWQQEFFERGHQVFEPKVSSNQQSQGKDKAKDEKIKILKDKLVRKNEVVSELMEELIKVKKEIGAL